MATSERAGSTVRRRRADGERRRQAIVRGAAELATVEGLDGLSIGRLADHIGMSKSGLYAHFDSKEELQLAAIDEAQDIFTREVTAPAMAAPEGLTRLVGLCDAFLSHLERRVFPGGCFFAAAAAEFDTHDGRVKERIRDFFEHWLADIADLIREAQARGEIDPSADADQLAFEIDSMLLGANAGFVLFADPRALQKARTGIRQRLGPAPKGPAPA
ncbi:MAG TPA: TetR/AcrR family transcriptional regulator [Thermoleophilaceae bacterium]|jgi:AcrR family transcriptional regulator